MGRARGPTIALVGVDGAGKSTVARRLVRDAPFPVHAIYMGTNPASADRVFVLTRMLRAFKSAPLGAVSVGASQPSSGGVRVQKDPRWRRAARHAKSVGFFVNLALEEWYRAFVARRLTRNGDVVVFDRHFIADYLASDDAHSDLATPWYRRAHVMMLRRVYPRPDVVVLLDARAETLYRRKREWPVPELEARGRRYRELRRLFEHFVVVDAERPVDRVVSDVMDIVRKARMGRITGE